MPGQVKDAAPGARYTAAIRSPAGARPTAAPAATARTAHPRPGATTTDESPMSLADLEALIRPVPDFPKPGILFRDITPLLAERLRDTIQHLSALYSDEEWSRIDAIVGIESRGFILASALAYARGRELLLVRKPGKLPPPVHRESYCLEYGTDALEIGCNQPPRRVLVVDDVIATGGTLVATCTLCERAGHTVQGIAALINLTALNRFEWHGQPPRWLFSY